MAIVEVTIVPLGTATPSLSPWVARAHQVLEEQARAAGLKTMLTPMSTILEGDLDRILAAIRQAHEAVFAAGALRVSTSIRIDDRRDKPASMEGKVRSVEEKLKGGTG
ncbi:MAG: MTH1187 family thiamine-binding protein [Bacillota bacterium]|nr:MAG: hypothetical protein DIU70_06010 [Bacillota bacterium]